MSDSLSTCERRALGYPCSLQCDVCEFSIQPMPETLKEKMRKELMLQLHCISSMFEHIEMNRDMMKFRDMMMHTACATRDAILTFDEELEAYKKEQK